MKIKYTVTEMDSMGIYTERTVEVNKKWKEMSKEEKK